MFETGGSSVAMNFKGKRYDINNQNSAEADTTRLSTVYSGMSTDADQQEYEADKPSGSGVQGSERKFFPTDGPPIFMSLKRASQQGQVNPAYQKDEDEDEDTDDDFLGDPECNSTSTERSDDFDDEEEGSSPPDDDSQRISDDYTTVQEPVQNGKIANGGRDFKVGFNDLEENSEPMQEHHQHKKKKEPKSWDKFLVSTKDNISNTDIKFWGTVSVVTKLVVAFLLFFLTLGTAVIAKICFIIVTANIYPRDNRTLHNNLKTLNGTLSYMHIKTHTNVQWIWALIMMTGAPYVFTCFKSLWRLLFQMSKRGNPTWIDILGILSIETVHSVGLNVMIFIVIPNLDPISGLLVTLCVGVVPSIMKIFYPTVGPSKLRHTWDRPSITTSAFITVISIIGAAGQLAALAIWGYHVYLEFNKSFPSIPYLVCLILAPIFTSVYWWENYVYEGTKDSEGIPQLARHMRKCRTKLTLYTSVWKMALTLVIPTAIYGINCDDGSINCAKTMYFEHKEAVLNSGIGSVDLVSEKNFGKCSNYLPLIVASIGVLCSGVCFKVGKVACKIMTQILDYSIPLVLSTPTTMGLILGMYAGFITTKDIGCAIPFPEWTENQNSYFGKFMDQDAFGIWIPALAGLSGFISLLLVTNHVWTPGKERLQRTDKLFVQPLYCGILLDQSLLLNRRRIEKAKSADTVKNKVTKIPLPDEMKESDDGDKQFFRTNDTPMIYMCATMWHETENEMTQLLKSVFRTDEDQCIRRHAQFLLGRRDPDYYEFEAHIFFDDAFEAHTEEEYEFKVNDYVRLLMKTIPVSASAIHGVSFKLKPPVTVATPYGGRLVWTLPGGNKLIAHLKDKTFIRHRKRWSQVMYMYYFLGYELFNKGLRRKQLQKKAENTYLLALDGDVDFHPQAVLLLVDRMRKNPDVGAACGRIHPIGNGAMVWYQKFEYAVSHWLQKAAEDKFGCVLCSPGCFSLFRGSSLMDENVMAKYTTAPTEPRHYVQYDQGEDRWLCTLLLQQGHRVEYCAASDALTYAPEGFYEFFNQRRRWTPSTMANIMDLLTDWKNVTKKNAEITIAYIFYQGLLMVSSILTPGTIFLMILGAINLAYPAIELWVALIVNVIPVAVMILLCFKAKPDTQLLYAAVLSTAYSLIMMIVIVGLLKQAAEYGLESITTLFLMFVAGVFVISALIHPQEFWCIIHGFLYFLAIPSMSMILMLYALGNLHVVSWGTRENKTAAEQQVEKKKEKEGKLSGVMSMFAGCCPWGQLFNQSEDDKLRIILDRLEGVELGLRELSVAGSTRSVLNESLVARSGTPIMMGNEEPPVSFTQLSSLFSGDGKRENPMYEEEKQVPRDRMRNPYWMNEDDEIRMLKQIKINTDETKFWWELIEEYLKPLDADKNKEKETLAALIELRNKVCLIFILINSLFIIIVFSLQQVVQDSNSLSLKLPWVEGDSVDNGQKIEPISVAFTLVFGVLLFVQFVCMLMHRMATLLHICAATEIFKKKRQFKMSGTETNEVEAGTEPTSNTAMSYDQVYELVRDMQKDQDADSASLTSESSFGGQSDIDEDEDAALRRRETREKWKRLAKNRRKVHENTLAANFRTNLSKIQSLIKEESPVAGEGSEESDDLQIERFKKKARFNRMRNKSIHVIAMISKDPKMKASIARKQFIKSRWTEIAAKSRMMEQTTASRMPKLSAHIVEFVRAKKAESDALKAIQDIGEASPALQRHEIQIHHEDTDEPDYTSIDDVHNRADGIPDKPPSPRVQRRLSTDSEPEMEVQPQLVVPKVDDDEWPEEDNYAVAEDDVRF